MKRITIVVSCLVMMVGCSLAPPFQRPELIVPNGYKEMGDWIKLTHPSPTLNSTWWELFNDSTLTELEEQLAVANPTLQAAVAAYDQSLALSKVARAAFFPTINALASGERAKTSRTVATPSKYRYINEAIAGMNYAYEIDVWGSVRNNYLAQKSLVKASQADIATVKLTLQALLAHYYYSVRALDLRQHILDNTVKTYEKAFYLTEQRYKVGVAAVSDTEESKAQYESAQTLATNNRLQRAQMEHAIAVLIGLPPADFSLPVHPAPLQPVTIAPHIPSTLLEHRPDIYSALLQVEAANYNIGVARSAFFPSFNLSGGAGFNSKTLAELFKIPSLVWSLGPASVVTLFSSGSGPLVSQTVFAGGKLWALSDLAWANYLESVANYKETILTAFQEVEDSLVAIKELDKQLITQRAAAQASLRVERQATNRYKGGITSYLEVTYYQNLALQAELEVIDILLRRQIASINLIKALGGGWNKV